MGAPRRVSSLTWSYMSSFVEVALLRVIHLVEVVQALGVVAKKQRRDAQRIALATSR